MSLDISIKTLYNLEEILAREIEDLGGEEVEIGSRIVHCKGDLKFLYKANYYLRTALRVLVPIKSFIATSTDELHFKSMQIHWDEYMDVNQTFAIDPVVNSSNFPHGLFAAQRLKDAIADSFVKKEGKRPDVNITDPDVRINLHIDEQRVNISLDSSGHSLNQRGYRISGAAAPLNEVLAAGMIMLTGWDRQSDFYDPMCGSGTLAIEAAMMAANIPPGSVYGIFGFMEWKNFDRDLWEEIVEEAKKNIRSLPVKIFASDISSDNVSITRQNFQRAGIKENIEIKRDDFFNLSPESEKGLMIINPPYGERMNDDSILKLYSEIGTHLKHRWPGFKAWIMSSNHSALKNIGLKPIRKAKLLNGTLECSFNGYELFSGKRKEFVMNR